MNKKTGFVDFIRTSSSLFKIPYWVILLLGGIYFLFIIEGELLTKIGAFVVVIGLSYWDWKRNQSKVNEK